MELQLDRGDAARRLARWAEQGWLRRVCRDLYIPVPVDAMDPTSWGGDPLVLADAVWAPCYATGWTAATHWGLTEQSFRTTVIKITQRVRHSARSLLDNDFMVAHTASQNLEWGMRREWREERRIRIADPARAVVDMLDDPGLGAGIRTVAECLGYLFERLLVDEKLLAACEDKLSEGFSALDPTQAKGGLRSQRWRLIVNVQLGDVASS